MPYKKKFQKKATKSKAVVKYRFRNRPMFPLAKSQIVKHRYVEQISLNPASGNADDYYFSCNNLFDPNITGVGHQPLLYDQVNAMYAQYIVLGSRIKVIHPGGATITTQPVLIVRKDDDLSANANPRTLIEQQRSGTSYKFLKNDSTATTVSLGWSLKKDEGVVDYAEQAYRWGATGGNPTIQKYFCVSYGDMAGSDLAAANVTVIIEYIAMWLRPLDVGES